MAEPGSDALLEFAQRAQVLVLQLEIDEDLLLRLRHTWDVMLDIPSGELSEERAVIAFMVQRVSHVFQQSARGTRRLNLVMARACPTRVRVWRALACLNDPSLSNYPSLGIAARHANISRTYLCRIVKDVTGYPWRVHVRGNRLLAAANLLATSASPIKEISYDAGYSQPAALDHDFRRWLHMSPGEYRGYAAVVGSTTPFEGIYGSSRMYGVDAQRSS